MAVINTNVSSLNASFYLSSASEGLKKSIQRLSSGSRLADAADDAAGIAVSSKLDSSIKRLTAASEGAQNLISFSQTADSFLKVIQDQLTRMSELAVRATNGAFSDSDRTNYSTEFLKLQTNITNQITNAKFNGTNVFSTTATVTGTVSADGANFFTLTLVNAMSSISAITAASVSVSTVAGASAAIGALTTALGSIASDRATVNADISSINFYITNLQAENVNVTAANSRIKDLDFAAESTELAKYNILVQAGTAMLAQANTSTQSTLSLLR